MYHKFRLFNCIYQSLKKTNKINLLTILCLLSSFFATANNDEKVSRLTWGHVYETSEPLHKWAVWAAEQIEQKTNGRYVIDVFPVSIMGKEAELNQSLSLGTMDLIYTGTSFAAQTYSAMALSDLLYVFRDYQHWQQFNKSDLYQDLIHGYKLASNGNQVIGNSYYGQRHLTSNKPILKPSDMAELKLRVPNATIFKMFPLSVGANPSPIAFSEVYLALQQGVVDAQENPLPTIKAKKFYEVQKYISLTGHLQGSIMSVASDRLWSRLSLADKQVFTAVFEEAALGVSKDTRQAENDLVAWFEEQGVTVLTVDRSLFRENVLPSHESMKPMIGEDFYDRLQAIK